MAQGLIRIGVLGCGAVATELHLPALRKLPDVEITAVCDIDLQRAQTVAQQFNSRHSLQNYADLIALSEIDVVVITTPPPFHAQLAIATLAASKHVFIEKPLAMTLEEADAIIAAAQQSDRKVMVGFNLRWHSLVRSAKAIIILPTLLFQLYSSAFGEGVGYVLGVRSETKEASALMETLRVAHIDPQDLQWLATPGV
jgi:predicted dehydrogenase